MIKERSEEIAYAVVLAAICDWLKCKNQENDLKRSSEILGDEKRFLVVDDPKIFKEIIGSTYF